METEETIVKPNLITTERGRVTRPSSAADQNGIWKWLPGLYTLRHYRLSWLRDDLVAGLVLTAVLVPVGMGYAEAAGLPAINGLYATIVPLLVYAIFGPSRILVLGPDSSLAAVIAAVIVPLAAGDPARVIALAGMLAVFTGLLCILAGLAHLGIITELISKPIRYGYMNGIALIVLIGQLPKLFGFSVDGDGVLAEFAAFIRGLLEGQANWVTLALGVTTLLIIFGFKRFTHFPGVLLAVIGATVVTAALDLTSRAGVSVVGVLPQGLPSFTIPVIHFQDIGPLLIGAVAIAVVSFADTSVLSRSLAAKSGTYVNPNQEMIALGAANVATGFFQGFSISSSASRTPVAEAAGSKTQLTGVTGAVAIALLLIFAPSLLKNLPNTALAAVVISSAIGLFEVRDLRRIYKIQRWEYWLSIACFLGVAIFGPIPGILIAILIALGEFVGDAWRPHHAVLGQPQEVPGYHDITRYPDAHLFPGLLLFRWDAPLFFANAEQFHERVLIEINNFPTPVRWFVVAAEPITDVDVSATDMLLALDAELQQAGIQLIFAELKDPVKDEFKRFGLWKRFEDRDCFFFTISEAVNAYQVSNRAERDDKDDGNRPG